MTAQPLRAYSYYAHNLFSSRSLTAMPDAPDTASPLTATLVQTLFPMTSKAVLNQRLPTLLAATVACYAHG